QSLSRWHSDGQGAPGGVGERRRPRAFGSRPRPICRPDRGRPAGEPGAVRAGLSLLFDGCPHLVAHQDPHRSSGAEHRRPGGRRLIGYLHTGIEKTFEAKSYMQGVVLTDRMDYLNPLGNNLAYALALEKLLGCEIPPRATVLRVLLAELTRIASHLMFVGSMALDLGASSPFLYCWREREKIL